MPTLKNSNSSLIDHPSPFALRTVVLAEDDASVRNFMASILEQAGYRVLSAGNGSQALEICNTHRGSVNVLITDVVMPETNGRELSERVRAILPEVKILFVSGYVDRGADDYDSAFLEKPFSAEVLLSALDRLCALTSSR